MEYILHLLITISIYVILVSSTSLLVGMANLLTLSQAAFYGIGAYTSALCLMHLHLSLFPCLLIVLFTNALIAALTALPTIRLRGDFFVLGTMAFQLIIYSLLNNLTSITNGSFGISNIPSPYLFSKHLPIQGLYGFVFLSILISGFVLLLLYRLISSPFGRALRALRENETLSTSNGRNNMFIKLIAFCISSALIGWAGFIFATYITYIDPTSFNIDESIFILAAVLIGGLGNIKGPLAGAIIVVLLPELLRFIGLPDSIAANLRQIIYGLLLIGIMYFKPQGILGSLKL